MHEKIKINKNQKMQRELSKISQLFIYRFIFNTKNILIPSNNHHNHKDIVPLKL